MAASHPGQSERQLRADFLAAFAEWEKDGYAAKLISLARRLRAEDLGDEGIASGSGPVPKSHLFGPAAPSSPKKER